MQGTKGIFRWPTTILTCPSSSAYFKETSGAYQDLCLIVMEDYVNWGHHLQGRRLGGVPRLGRRDLQARDLDDLRASTSRWGPFARLPCRIWPFPTCSVTPSASRLAWVNGSSAGRSWPPPVSARTPDRS